MLKYLKISTEVLRDNPEKVREKENLYLKRIWGITVVAASLQRLQDRKLKSDLNDLRKVFASKAAG